MSESGGLLSGIVYLEASMYLGGYVPEDFIRLWAVDQFHQTSIPDAGSRICFLGDVRVAWAVQEDVSDRLLGGMVADASRAVHDVETLKVAAEAAVAREELSLGEVCDDVSWNPGRCREELFHRGVCFRQVLAVDFPP